MEKEEVSVYNGSLGLHNKHPGDVQLNEDITLRAPKKNKMPAIKTANQVSYQNQKTQEIPNSQKNQEVQNTQEKIKKSLLRKFMEGVLNSTIFLGFLVLSPATLLLKKGFSLLTGKKMENTFKDGFFKGFVNETMKNTRVTTNVLNITEKSIKLVTKNIGDGIKEVGNGIGNGIKKTRENIANIPKTLVNFALFVPRQIAHNLYNLFEDPKKYFREIKYTLKGLTKEEIEKEEAEIIERNELLQGEMKKLQIAKNKTAKDSIKRENRKKNREERAKKREIEEKEFLNEEKKDQKMLKKIEKENKAQEKITKGQIEAIETMNENLLELQKKLDLLKKEMKREIEKYEKENGKNTANEAINKNKQDTENDIEEPLLNDSEAEENEKNNIGKKHKNKIEKIRKEIEKKSREIMIKEKERAEASERLSIQLKIQEEEKLEKEEEFEFRKNRRMEMAEKREEEAKQDKEEEERDKEEEINDKMKIKIAAKMPSIIKKKLEGKELKEYEMDILNQAEILDFYTFEDSRKKPQNVNNNSTSKETEVETESIENPIANDITEIFDTSNTQPKPEVQSIDSDETINLEEENIRSRSASFSYSQTIGEEEALQPELRARANTIDNSDIFANVGDVFNTLPENNTSNTTSEVLSSLSSLETQESIETPKQEEEMQTEELSNSVNNQELETEVDNFIEQKKAQSNPTKEEDGSLADDESEELEEIEEDEEIYVAVANQVLETNPTINSLIDPLKKAETRESMDGELDGKSSTAIAIHKQKEGNRML